MMNMNNEKKKSFSTPFHEDMFRPPQTHELDSPASEVQNEIGKCLTARQWGWFRPPSGVPPVSAASPAILYEHPNFFQLVIAITPRFNASSSKWKTLCILSLFPMSLAEDIGDFRMVQRNCIATNCNVFATLHWIWTFKIRSRPRRKILLIYKLRLII